MPGAAAELVDERRVEPRLVDPQRRVDHQAVAVEALDVVALVGRAVAPHVDAVVLHRPHEQRAGDRAPERRRVEVRPAGGADVERTALQRHQALADELVAAVDESRLLGAVDLGAVRDTGEVGLVGLAEVGGVGVRDRAPLAHPGDGGRRVETTGERDSDPFADGQRHQHLGHGAEPIGTRDGVMPCLDPIGQSLGREPAAGSARYVPVSEAIETSGAETCDQQLQGSDRGDVSQVGEAVARRHTGCGETRTSPAIGRG